MQPSRVRQRWAQDKPVFCTQVKLTDPTCSELIAMQGYDCIWVDLEHHPHHLETLVALTRGAQRYGADILARPAKWEYMRMGRMLEAGLYLPPSGYEVCFISAAHTDELLDEAAQTFITVIQTEAHTWA
ncbi:MAG: hypothetical protein IIB33_01305 [Chloroflexi bacterium]|nr:hypothetical protein [Chloroflexota bacterium]